MLITLIWMLGFCLGMLFTIPFLCIYYIAKLLAGNEKADKLAFFFTRFWAKSIIISTCSKVNIIGKENLTTSRNVCFIANHQSYFDIPVMMGWLGRPIGFIAKKELKKVPILSGWITAIHSAFLDRSNPRKAIESINKGAENIKAGHAIVIFPEGTRSKDGQVHDFKTGSLKLAFGSGAVIQPVTINGSRVIFEQNKRIRKSEISLIIHSAIHPNDDIYKDKTMLIEKLQHVIASGIKL
jgi:1-acyl-sn-glycerol-3-phosphate acyltransferase